MVDLPKSSPSNLFPISFCNLVFFGGILSWLSGPGLGGSDGLKILFGGFVGAVDGADGSGICADSVITSFSD